MPPPRRSHPPRKQRPSRPRAPAYPRRSLLAEIGEPRLGPLLRSTARRPGSRFVLTPRTNQGETAMRREQLTEKILDIKCEKGWSWKQITDEIGGMSPVLVVGALLGQMKLVKPLARKATALFGLS